MRELSLHILDIVQNSIRANASKVEMKIELSHQSDLLVIEIKDNGEGMSPELAKAVLDPFVTTRTTRRVGLGLPLFKAAAERSAGELILNSTEGMGTLVKASFQYSHIDRTPMGDLVSTMLTLIQGSPEVDFYLKCICDDEEYELDTQLIRQEMEGVPLNHPLILEFIGNDLRQGIVGELID